jgi:hypothetical protein
MQALMECGYTTTIFGDLYKMLFTKESRINVLMEAKYPEPVEIIKAIHEAGGIAVLAHPGFYNNFELLEELIPEGLDGVEVWHADMSARERARAYEMALERGLYISGGEDHSGLCGGQYKFHSNPKETRHWAEPCSLGTTKEFFEEIRDCKFNPDRERYIKSYMELYSDTKIPDFSDFDNA